MKSKSPHFKQLSILCLLIILKINNSIAQPGKVFVNGITIAYESYGNKTDESIILIQGTGATMLHYPIELCERLLANDFNVIRFDNRDVGLSTHLDLLGQPDWAEIGPYIGTCNPAPLQYTLLDMAMDVIGLMDALKIKKAHIVGASMGASIAQLIAIHFPERVITLTSMASSTGNPTRPQGNPDALKAMSTPPPTTSNTDSLANYLVNVYKALGGVDNDLVLKERALNHIKNRNWDPESVNRQVAAVIIGDYCDRREQLAQLNIPTIVLHGNADPLVPLEAGKEVASTIPKAELCIIDGMGHDISMKFVSQIGDCIIKIASQSGK
ncbi:MAG: alpha/beta hydrolase [Bacilli bacterium]|jgi:pimeloyl-ACP methyl ester carboxylesterase